MPVTFTSTIQPSGNIAQIIRPNTKRYMTPKVQRATNAVRQEAPVDAQGGGGALKRSVVMRARDGAGRFTSQAGRNPAIVSFEIAVEVPYASYVIRGTKPHTIKSHGPWSLHNRKTGAFFGHMVRHPGAKANNFIERGLRKAGF